MRKGNAPAAKELPGWNETGDKWADMDKLTEEDLAEQELAGLALVQPASLCMQLNLACNALHTSADIALSRHLPVLTFAYRGAPEQALSTSGLSIS